MKILTTLMLAALAACIFAATSSAAPSTANTAAASAIVFNHDNGWDNGWDNGRDVTSSFTIDGKCQKLSDHQKFLGKDARELTEIAQHGGTFLTRDWVQTGPFPWWGHYVWTSHMVSLGCAGPAAYVAPPSAGFLCMSNGLDTNNVVLYTDPDAGQAALNSGEAYQPVAVAGDTTFGNLEDHAGLNDAFGLNCLKNLKLTGAYVGSGENYNGGSDVWGPQPQNGLPGGVFGAYPVGTKS